MKVLIPTACAALLSACTGFAAAGSRGTSLPPRVAGYQYRSGDLRYHGGPVMPRTRGYVVFWQPIGTHFETSRAGDDRYRALVRRYLRDVGGTSFYRILTLYSYVLPAASTTPLHPPGARAPGGPIRNSSTLLGTYTDSTPYPRAGTNDDPLLYQDMATPVRRAIAAMHWKTGLSHLFYLFTAGSPVSCYVGTAECIPTQGCATHVSYGPASHPTIVVIIPSLVHYRSCSGAVSAFAATGHASPNGDPMADAAIDVLSHEQFEAVTDPVDGNSVTPVSTNAWYASSPAYGEIGDRCQSYAFTGRPDVSLHGHRYALQPEWSNLDHRCLFRFPPR